MNFLRYSLLLALCLTTGNPLFAITAYPSVEDYELAEDADVDETGTTEASEVSSFVRFEIPSGEKAVVTFVATPSEDMHLAVGLFRVGTDGEWFSELEAVAVLPPSQEWEIELSGYDEALTKYVFSMQVVDGDGNPYEGSALIDVGWSISSDEASPATLGSVAPTWEDYLSADSWALPGELEVTLGQDKQHIAVETDAWQAVTILASNLSPEVGAFSLTLYKYDEEQSVFKCVDFGTHVPYSTFAFPNTLQTNDLVTKEIVRDNEVLLLTLRRIAADDDEATDLDVLLNGETEEASGESEDEDRKEKESRANAERNYFDDHTEPYSPAEEEDLGDPLRHHEAVDDRAPVFWQPDPENEPPPEGNDPTHCKWKIEIVHNLADFEPSVANLPSIIKHGGDPDDPDDDHTHQGKGDTGTTPGAGFLNGAGYGGSSFAFGSFGYKLGGGQIAANETDSMAVDESGTYTGYVRITCVPIGDCQHLAKGDVYSALRAGVIVGRNDDVPPSLGGSASGAAASYRSVVVSPLGIDVEHNSKASAGLKKNFKLTASFPPGTSAEIEFDKDNQDASPDPDVKTATSALQGVEEVVATVSCASMCQLKGTYSRLGGTSLLQVNAIGLADFGYVALTLVCKPAGDCNTLHTIRFVYYYGPRQTTATTPQGIAIKAWVDPDYAEIDPDSIETGLTDDGTGFSETTTINGK